MLYKQHSVLVLANQWGYYIIQPPTNNWRWRELVETWKKKWFIVATEGDAHLLVLSLHSVWNPIQDGGTMPHTSHSFTTPKEFGSKPDQYPVNIKIAGILCCSSSSLKMPWVTHRYTVLIHHHWWRFPEIGVPPVIIHFNGIVHYKPSIWGYPHLWKPPYYERSPTFHTKRRRPTSALTSGTVPLVSSAALPESNSTESLLNIDRCSVTLLNYTECD